MKNTKLFLSGHHEMFFEPRRVFKVPCEDPYTGEDPKKFPEYKALRDSIVQMQRVIPFLPLESKESPECKETSTPSGAPAELNEVTQQKEKNLLAHVQDFFKTADPKRLIEGRFGFLAEINPDNYDDPNLPLELHYSIGGGRLDKTIFDWKQAGFQNKKEVQEYLHDNDRTLQIMSDSYRGIRDIQTANPDKPDLFKTL